jgi:hypothetical protein
MILCVAFASALAATPKASAQSWEVEVHGGLAWTNSPSTGSGSLAGTSSASGTTVPSWYFGDGAMALNQALTSFGSTVQLSALDGALQGPFFQGSTGGVLGLRVARRLTSRFAAEFSFDNAFSQIQAISGSVTALDAASTSFISAWNALLAAPSHGTQTVTSTTSVSHGSRRFATGAVVVNLTTGGRVVPYATAGAGVVTSGGPSARVSGSYRFTVVQLPIGSTVPAASYSETDTVTIGRSDTSGPAGVFGGGVKIAVGRGGLRIDVRDHLMGSNGVTVTTTPTSQPQTPTGIFVLGTSPPLQFSTVAGVPSTLSQALSQVPTFHGTGMENQVELTVGWYWRF